MILDALFAYGFEKPLSEAGFLPTETVKRVYSRIRGLALSYGSLIVISGSVGSGKTTMVNQLIKELKDEKRCLVSYSFSSDRQQVNVKTLLAALFIDLSKSDKVVKMPTSPEIRDRTLVKLMEDVGKPVILFIDEAQDLHPNTLSSLKKLTEIAKTSGLILTIILAGQPKLKNAIRAPKMEEIGARAYVIDLDEQRVMGSNDRYLQWAMAQCLSKEVRLPEIIAADALKLLTEQVTTPLQMIWLFNKALELAYTSNIKPIDLKSVEKAISLCATAYGEARPQQRVEVRPAARPIETIRPIEAARIIEPVRT